MGRYIGSRTDEPLCREGRELLEGRFYPDVSRIYVSPMKRCVETARLIWPEMSGRMIPVSDLRECDFGDFENKSYRELNGNPDYQAWMGNPWRALRNAAGGGLHRLSGKLPAWRQAREKRCPSVLPSLPTGGRLCPSWNDMAFLKGRILTIR